MPPGCVVPRQEVGAKVLHLGSTPRVGHMESRLFWACSLCLDLGYAQAGHFACEPEFAGKEGYVLSVGPPDPAGTYPS